MLILSNLKSENKVIYYYVVLVAVINIPISNITIIFYDHNGYMPSLVE